MPKVSIITGAYNQERYIAETLRSVQAQTYRDFEHVVVDDGSNDGTAAVIETFADRVRFIRQENQGNIASRNNAFAASSGAYIAVLDGDDVWDPMKLEEQVDILDAFPDVGLVYTGMVEMDENGVTITAPCADDISADPLPKQLLGNAVPFSSMLMRREVFDKGVILDPRFNQVGDRYLTLQVILQGRGLACVPRTLLRLRTHAASMRYSPAFRRSYLAQTLEMISDVERDPRYPEDRRNLIPKAYAQAYIATAWVMIGRGSREEQWKAWSLLRKGWSYDRATFPAVFKQFVKSIVRPNPPEQA